MSRNCENDLTALFQVVERWKSTCLTGDGSVLSDWKLWTLAHLDELDRAFVQHPMEGSESFLEKFSQQLSNVSAEAKQLAAELLWVLHLFPTNIGGPVKCEQIRRIWSWSGSSLPTPHAFLEKLLDAGVGSAGQGFLTYRNRELVFLILAMRALKKLDAKARTAVLSDPWAFGRWLATVKEADRRQLRHILVYLLFPDTYERIASPTHKSKIAAAFAAELKPAGPKPPEGLDALTALDWKLKCIRDELEKRTPGTQIDFYWQPLVAQWDPERNEPPLDPPADVSGSLGVPFNRIFKDRAEAEWFFAELETSLNRLGVSSPDDKRYALTLPAGRNSMRLNYGQWLLLGCTGMQEGEDRFIFALKAAHALSLGLEQEISFRAKGNSADVAVYAFSLITHGDVQSVMAQMNRRITLRKDRDHQIGHSYFMNTEDYDAVFRSRVFPLLQEYFYNDWDGLRFVLGESDRPPTFVLPLSESNDGKWARTKWAWFQDKGVTIDDCLAALKANYTPATPSTE